MSEHAFDPNWPHGHYLVNDHGDLSEARIRLTDVAGDFPIVAEWLDGDRWRGSTFTADGRWMAGHRIRLINRPAPEPVVVEVRRHINDYFFGGSRTPDGLPPRVRVETAVTLFSDGTARASAEVVK